ncbi:MAG: hypothetical protein NTW67_06395 [Candidatus Woesearchaeota archaeon]|nr:hypothetical protein [Candidatus Woesearchaeota archaeon]
MSEIPEKELSRRVRLAYDYCKFCYDHIKGPRIITVTGQHENMALFFHGVNIPFEGKGSFEFNMVEKCIKCFESYYQQPEVANFLESKLSSHLQKEESK